MTAIMHEDLLRTIDEQEVQIDTLKARLGRAIIMLGMDLPCPRNHSCDTLERVCVECVLEWVRNGDPEGETWPH